MEVMVSCHSGGRRPRMRRRSWAASGGRKSLRMYAAWTARSRIQDRAMSETTSLGERGVDPGAELWKVSSMRIETRDWLEGAEMREMLSFRKASTDAW